MSLNELEYALTEALKRLRMARIVATYQAGEEGLILPTYKGSLLRGAFGHALRKMVCTCNGLHNDEHSANEKHEPDCVYGYIFEGNVSIDAVMQRGEVPRPIVMVPPLEKKQEYFPGETFSLTITLFGDSISYLPYLFNVLESMGENGLGKGRQHAGLRQVFRQDIHGEVWPIYDRRKRILNTDETEFRAIDIVQQLNYRSDRLNVYFETPTRIQQMGQNVVTPEFHLIVRNLIRRLTSLLYFYHGQYRMEIDFKQVFRDAETVSLLHNETSWYDWERYSNRQKERMKLGGIIGKAVYEGTWQPFYLLVKLAEWIHVGKNPMFGLGKVKVFT